MNFNVDGVQVNVREEDSEEQYSLEAVDTLEDRRVWKAKGSTAKIASSGIATSTSISGSDEGKGTSFNCFAA